jgi:hypothetical protein
MFYSTLFALLLITVVLLKYFWRPLPKCPQCDTKRDTETPLCAECGWIFEVPGDDDDQEDRDTVW